MAVQKIGDKVQYHMEPNMDQPHLAVVVFVQPNDTLNLVCYDLNGNQYTENSVVFVPAGDIAPGADYCELIT